MCVNGTEWRKRDCRGRGDIHCEVEWNKTNVIKQYIRRYYEVSIQDFKTIKKQIVSLNSQWKIVSDTGTKAYKKNDNNDHHRCRWMTRHSRIKFNATKNDMRKNNHFSYLMVSGKKKRYKMHVHYFIAETVSVSISASLSLCWASRRIF